MTDEKIYIGTVKSKLEKNDKYNGEYLPYLGAKLYLFKHDGNQYDIIWDCKYESCEYNMYNEQLVEWFYSTNYKLFFEKSIFFSDGYFFNMKDILKKINILRKTASVYGLGFEIYEPNGISKRKVINKIRSTKITDDVQKLWESLYYMIKQIYNNLNYNNKNIYDKE